MSEFHGLVIVVLGVVHPAHHALIITEEEDGQASHTIDGNQKTALLEPVHHIGFWNDIHVGRRLLVVLDSSEVEGEGQQWGGGG